MSFVLGVAQCSHAADGNEVELARRWMRKSRAANVDLLVFPECLMGPWDKSLGAYANVPEPLEGPFVSALASEAKDCGLWAVVTMNEAAGGDVAGGDAAAVRDDVAFDALAHDAAALDVRPYNTAVVIGADGRIHGTYRKVHLYDAFSERESDRLRAGEGSLCVVETPFCKLGLGICYDLRFPELARSLALVGSEVLVFPAAWHDGPHKADQWHTLLAARAIENEIFVVGAGRPDGDCIGQSTIVGPLGETLAVAGRSDELLVATIDLEELVSARKGMPVLDHRRPELYGLVVEAS